ncbi:TonB-dependent receptor [bacterium]|nr:TonB-dependent receptor [bacterium]
MKNTSRFCLIIAALHSSIMAGNGIIEGLVQDSETKAPLPGANIIIRGTSLGSAANQTGQYVVRNIPPGHYSVQATMIGYQADLESDVVVEANRATQLIFVLKEKVIETEAITVNGSFFNGTNDAVVSTHTLSSREIRSAPGAIEDVFRVLKTLPGVGTTGSSSANLIVRGGDRNENLVLLDHIEIRSPLHFSREGMSMGVISIVDPRFIRNIDFMTGGFPVVYGDKLSSVFNIQLKEGNRTQFNHDINMSMGGFSVGMDGPVSQRGNVLFSMRRGIFDIFTKMMNRPVSPRYWDMIGKFSYDLNDKNKLSLIGFYYKDDAERCEKMEGHGEFARKYEYVQWDDDGAALGLNWRLMLNASGFIRTTAEWSSNGIQSIMGTNSKRDMNGDDTRIHTLHLKSRLHYKLHPKVSVDAGGYIKHLTADCHQWREADTLEAGFIVPDFETVYRFPGSKKGGIYVQSTIRPFHRLSVTPGLRWEKFAFTGVSRWSPRMSAVYYLSEKITLNMAAGYYYQSPSLFQICIDPENHTLQSSRAFHTVMGVEYLLRPDTRITLELYDKRMDNGFVKNDTNNVIINGGSGFSNGFEVTLQQKMSGNLVGSLAYTWSVSKRQDANDLPEYNFDYDRRHNFILTGSYQLSDKWRIGLKYQYAAGNPYTPVIESKQLYGAWFVVEGERNSRRYPDYHTLDIRADRIFRFSSWALKTYLEIWNIYNRDNVLDYYYDIEPDGSIERVTAADFPLMPMLGINVEF